MSSRHCKIAGFLAGTLISINALAQVPELAPLQLQAKYNVDWNNIGIGRIRVLGGEDQFGYKLTVDTKTRGIAKWFSDERTVAKIEGHKNGSAYIPTRYTSERNRADKGHTDIRYDAEGKIATRIHEPEDDPKWRPPVPTEEANTATDPLSAGFILRQKIRDNMAADIRETTVRTYDGSRLAEMTIKVVSRARVEIGGEYRDAINTVVTRKPIAGYTPKEIKKFEKGDPVIHLYFSADKDFMPLKATLAVGFGEISAELDTDKD